MKREGNILTIMIDNRQDLYSTESIETLIETTITKTAICEDLKQGYQVSIILVDNEQIKNINKDYRGIDLPTDVLSFPMLNYDGDDAISDNPCSREESIDMDTGEIVLGDIAISLERAFEQSQDYGHSFEREVSFLAVHGMLHLLGYNHEAEEDRKIMRYKEEHILESINLKR